MAVADLLETAMVSAIGTYFPGRPVNSSATWNGCDRKRWIFLARADDELVFVRELLDPQDGDDVLEVLVALQDLLHPAGDRIVLLADNAGVQNSRKRVEGIDGRVDSRCRSAPG